MNGYTYRITYRKLFGKVVREFETHERAERWLRQIGKGHLIVQIERIEGEK